MRGEILYRSIKLRYRLLNMNNKEYLLDFNANKFVFIFPFLYLFTGVKAYEMTYEDSKQIEYDYRKPGFWFNAAPGMGVLLGVLIRPYIELLKIESSSAINIFLIMMLISLGCVLRLNMSKKAEIKFKMVNEPIVLKIKPRLKDIIFVTWGMVFCIICVTASLYILLFYEQNILFYLGIILFLFLYMIMHFSLYRPGSVEVRKLKAYKRR
ncbi:DUF443 family protein [Macrococcus armenti]|uniref:DUF443 family protein n=1 Tax=Macrococcus armenti TaxID=2875764 RepID=UPI001CCAB23C|nr:DUF443 family protein [Macrococcus armenti]UBH15629.1 DUF443 domain-containing protein [Macrococcus armenti]UBH17990.1 DUF443 domain-containing protein [Macrococcus armenti]UBH20255.1 DUF443 domain-containing protein [Macrococcus armenti]